MAGWTMVLAALVAGRGDGGAAPAPGGDAERSPPVRSLAPCLLVATRQLVDPNFEKTVVLLVSHDDEGAVGLVLNRPTRIRGADVARRLGVKVAGRAATAPVLSGGPVDPDRGFVLHARTDLAENRGLVPGLYVDGPDKVLEALLKDGEARARLAVGYAGWGGGQIEVELSRGDWAVVPASARAVFDVAPEALWETVRVEHGLRLDGDGPPETRAPGTVERRGGVRSAPTR